MEEAFAGMPEDVHELSRDQVEAMLGPRLSQLLKELTDSIIDFADKGVESTLAIAGSIVHAARPMTGGARVLAIAAANRAIPPSEQIAVV